MPKKSDQRLGLRKSESQFLPREIGASKKRLASQMQLEIDGMREIASKMEQLEKEVASSKLFMNMCIHDMRNPTVAIKLGLQQAIMQIEEISKQIQMHKQFKQNSKEVTETITNMKKNHSVQIVDHNNLIQNYSLQDLAQYINEQIT